MSHTILHACHLTTNLSISVKFGNMYNTHRIDPVRQISCLVSCKKSLYDIVEMSSETLP